MAPCTRKTRIFVMTNRSMWIRNIRITAQTSSASPSTINSHQAAPAFTIAM